MGTFNVLTQGFMLAKNFWTPNATNQYFVRLNQLRTAQAAGIGQQTRAGG